MDFETNTTYLRSHGFTINVRVDKFFQDAKVIAEVFGSDPYGLGALPEIFSGDPPKVILDIGGHIGCFGLAVKNFWPDVLLIAVEPFTDNARLYRMNMEDNGFSNYEVIEAACCYDPNKWLVNSPTSTGGHRILSPDSAKFLIGRDVNSYNEVVKYAPDCITIEEILEKYSISQVDLAKFDCEGTEVEILSQISPEAALAFRYIVGEVHFWSGRKRFYTEHIDEVLKYWKGIERKFAHLNFLYPHKKLGLFNAWPKEKLCQKRPRQLYTLPITA